MAYVSRDPFAREELHKTYIHGADCAWCGSQVTVRGGRKGAYRYRVETDGGRKSEDRKTFCGVDCRETYGG